MSTFKSFRPLALPVVISALALAGCNNDTGSTVLPGGGHGHDHGHDHAPEARKLSTPERLSQVDAHPQVAQFVAFASGNQTLYRINPGSGHQHEIDWRENEQQARIAHGFSHDGQQFVILDNQGRLTVLNSADWSVEHRVQILDADSPSGTTLALSGRQAVAFVSDIEHGSVHSIDLHDGELSQIGDHSLNATGPLTWVGPSSRQAPASDHDDHDHDHDHDHSHGHAHHAELTHDDGHDHEHEHDDHDHEHDNDHDHDHPGKLVIASGHDHLVVFNLKTDAVETELHLDFPAHRIHTSPDSGFALVSQRPDGQPQQVQVVDGGLKIDDGELHAHSAKLTNYRLFGERPAHFVANDHYGTLFFDGGHQGPRFVTLTDDSLERHRIVASESVLAPHHGVAVPAGRFVISSNENRDGVMVFAQHGSHYDLAHRIDEPCHHLHGAAVRHDYAGFGCEDGLLLVDLGSLSDSHDHEHGHHDDDHHYHDHGHHDDDHHDHDHGHHGDDHHDHDHGHHDDDHHDHDHGHHDDDHHDHDHGHHDDDHHDDGHHHH